MINTADGRPAFIWWQPVARLSLNLARNNRFGPSLPLLQQVE